MADFRVRSWAREYGVSFVDDFRVRLRQLVEGGALVAASWSAWEHHGEGVDVPEARLLLVDASEALKSWEGVRWLLEELGGRGFSGSERLVAVGGGTVQDLVSFTAGIYHRGVEWTLFPTTLLSQCDSCVGSKSAINVGATKNVVGGFWPPSEVILDARFLETLPEADVRSGIGELTHFLVFGGSPLLSDLPNEYPHLLTDRARLTRYVRESLRIKAEVVQRDEFDHGERNLLNYGHTFGHALESATGYRVRHGEAVAWGMDTANRLSVELGMLPRDEYERIHAAVSLTLPDLSNTEVSEEAFLAAIRRDRKNHTPGHLTCVLCRGAGYLVLHTLPLDAWLRGWLAARLRSPEPVGAP